MSDDGIQLDSDESAEEKPAKKKDLAGTMMAVMAIITFACLAAALTLQFLEYRYMRGVDNPEDRFSSDVVFPPQS